MPASVRRQAAEGKPLAEISATSGFTLDEVQRMVTSNTAAE